MLELDVVVLLELDDLNQSAMNHTKMGKHETYDDVLLVLETDEELDNHEL